MYTFEQLLSLFEEEIENLPLEKEPKLLYQPIRYLLKSGGKRIRPVMAIMAHNIFSDDVSDSLHAAMAIELFHNFTLLHDDIMDNASIRRGRPTANRKWNNNVAILSGDTMTVMAYQFLAKTPQHCQADVIDIFNKFAIDICEGQRYDMDFEEIDEITKEQYINMIRLKTSVLLAGSIEIGAVIGGADKQTRDKLYKFGEYLGLAFQLTDDMLDTYGNSESFGKEIGGDITEGKKTFLFVSTLLNAPIEKHKEIISLFKSDDLPKQEKINRVKACYDLYQAKKAIEDEILLYYHLATDILSTIDIADDKKDYFYKFAKSLIERIK